MCVMYVSVVCACECVMYMRECVCIVCANVFVLCM